MNIYVGNLPYGFDEDAITALFGEYGDVVEATIIMDKMSGRSKGFGFVEFGDDAAANAAIEALDGKDYNGRDMKVNIARPKTY